MTAVQAPPAVAPSSLAKAKMEDRKRSLAADGDDAAPRARKLLKDENGQPMRMDAEKEKEVENYQKDAILRQMNEYKRQKRDIETRFSELSKRTKYHHDHIRTIDAWFAQMLDEVRVLAGQTLPGIPPSADAAAGEEMYGSALLFENSMQFKEHLSSRTQNIKACIQELFGRFNSWSPEAEELRRQFNEVLAKEKEQAVELRSSLDDQLSLKTKWEAAVERYMVAEKKLDRAKSLQVLKVERQAMMGGNGEASSPTITKKAGTPVKSEHETNGELSNSVSGAGSEISMKEMLAVVEKQKTQVEE
ncbi:E3 ubiquitin-protein ligase bre1, partial [Teratosphaeriaceae sp. CCFEE 6253]